MDIETAKEDTAMKLTETDRTYLKSIGYREKDMQQIEVATSLTRYEYQGNLICDEKAMELLGREAYLSGIGRSAFHWTATRETKDGDMIMFNSEALFRR